jgi:regulator of sigma E protease
MIMTTFVQIAIGLFVLGILVLVHEAGHFVAAKLVGIRVLSFSIGFGRPLLRRRIGATEYRLGSVPFGGYVHMAGEHPEDVRESRPDEFPSKPVWQRALVAVAGPLANYLSAVLFLWVALIIGIKAPLYLSSPVVGDVQDSTAALRAGIQPGDRLVSINGEEVENWTDIERALTQAHPTHEVRVQRGEEYLELVLQQEPNTGAEIPTHPTAGMLPAPPPVIGVVEQGTPAARAGVMPGDSVVSLNDTPIRSWLHLSSLVARYDTTAGAIALGLIRGDSLVTATVVPEYSEANQRFLIGVKMRDAPARVVRAGVFEAVPLSLQRSFDMVVLIAQTLKRLITREVSPRQLAGPVGIVQMSGGVALAGIVPTLRFMALIGINLALLNLLPLVITDGGLLLFMLVEVMRGKPLSARHQGLINRIAIAFFVVLFLYVTFNDIARIPQLFRMTGR